MSAPSIASGISLRNASFRYPRAEVLLDVSVDLPKGTTHVITGANGTGKSSFLQLVAGLVPLESGTVTLGGHRPNAVRPSELFRRGVRRGFVFQEGGLLSNLTGLANVALALRYHADLLGLSVAQVDDRARAALSRVLVTEDEMNRLPAHLSVGVRKRIVLARAIAVEPNFFYFDDPDLGVDPKTAALIHDILRGYRDDPEVTMVVATNREALVEQLEAPGYVLEQGRLIERGR